jgi:3-oxoacyl-[acyl-carrier protein] reductase
MNKLDNQVAIVVGASRGIGRATAICLDGLKCKVVGVYEKNDTQASELVKQCKNIVMIKADIGKENDVINVVNTTIDKFGKIDILINNAGICISGAISNYSLENWNRMIAVNLTSKFLFTKYCIPYLSKSKDGVIINVSSRLGLNEYTFADFVCYGVNNAGIINLTSGSAKDLKPNGIRVNTVIPTVTNTDRFKEAFTKEEQADIIKAGKLGTPAEVADMIVSLILDKSKTGEMIIDKRVYLKSDA